MINRNEENLKELFERFVDSEQAKRAVEDIRKAEQILRENPAPQPKDELIAEIKSEIGAELLRRQTTRVFKFRKPIYKIAAVAAAVIFFSAISLKFFPGTAVPEKDVRIDYVSIIPASIWESDDIATDDADLAILNAEIEQIEGEVLALQSDQGEGNGQRAVTELEMELIEIESDFWKG